ncbi:packaged DNA stabilization gp4 family protein [Dyadobacter sp. CY261]|uniref:packaged DNA stabilization gp4 family protein n=1 Tax=Dyadobacter sp. CY261 TaxID=2907203 RepID=UPI001F21CC52|nr:packaged DNA stabilization gp4 family protein [Dyadobacter sp. CY261]MCF0075443.1 packaged DNA stabilization gp4 family protein [Dyadobacter sp. CY261]
MQKLGVITRNQEPEADETNDALDQLNALLLSWSNESLMIYVRNRQTFNLVAGQGAYTIGTGQNFNTPRPIQILDAMSSTGDVFSPINIVSDEIFIESQSLPNQQGVPTMLNYDNNYPVGTIRLWPIPAAADKLTLLMEASLTQFELDDEVDLPPGWERMIIYNLAIELAPDYGQQVSPELLELARDAKALVARAVTKARSMDSPYNVGQGFNIWSGYYQ